MEESELLKKGYLLKCPQKARAFKKWNSRWFVLYGNSARGRVRLEYYDNEKSWQQERSKRIIPLVHCVSIKPVWNKDYSHVIEIVTSDKTFYLGAGSKDEEKAWFKALCKAVFGNANRNSIVTVLDRPDPLDMGYHSLDRDTGADDNLERCRGASFAHSSPQLSKILGSREKIGEDSTINDQLNMTDSSNETVQRNTASSLSCELSSIISFESGFDDGASLVSSVAEGSSSYQVSVRPTIASKESGIVGEYILQITPLSLNLIDIPTQTIVAEWPIHHLRRYGRGRTKFSFESGDSCRSAVGVYTFSTVEGDAIFHQVDTYAKKLSSLHKSDNRDKRVSLPADQFRALNEKRRTKSEGKLADRPLLGTNNSNEIIESNEKINVNHQNTFPSKSRAVTLDAIKDVDKHTDVFERPRAKTDGSLEINHDESDATSYGESTESLLKNPIRSDIDSIDEKASKEDLSEDTRKEEVIQDEGHSVTSSVKGFMNHDKDSAVSNLKEAEVDEIKGETSKVYLRNDEETLNTESTTVDGIIEKETIFQPLSTSEVSSPSATPEITHEVDPVHNNNKEQGLLNEHDEFVNGIEKTETRTTTETKLPCVNGKEYQQTQEVEKAITEMKQQMPIRRKPRKQACRNKSFEFGSMSEKTEDNRKQSGSFSSFDYRKYQFNPDSINKADNGPRKLQRFTSVKKTVEMYEKLQVVANETRLKGFTLWKKKSIKLPQKPEPFIRTNEKII